MSRGTGRRDVQRKRRRRRRVIDDEGWRLMSAAGIFVTRQFARIWWRKLERISRGFWRSADSDPGHVL